MRNVLERLVLLSPGREPITTADVLQVLPRKSLSDLAADTDGLPLEEIERRHIQRVLDASGGNKTKTAQTLQIDYKTLLTKLKRYRLDS